MEILFDIRALHNGRYMSTDDAMLEARLLGVTAGPNNWEPLIAELKRCGLMDMGMGRYCEHSRGKT